MQELLNEKWVRAFCTQPERHVDATTNAVVTTVQVLDEMLFDDLLPRLLFYEDRIGGVMTCDPGTTRQLRQACGDTWSHTSDLVWSFFCTLYCQVGRPELEDIVALANKSNKLNAATASSTDCHASSSDSNADSNAVAEAPTVVAAAAAATETSSTTTLPLVPIDRICAAWSARKNEKKGMAWFWQQLTAAEQEAALSWWRRKAKWTSAVMHHPDARFNPYEMDAMQTLRSALQSDDDKEQFSADNRSKIDALTKALEQRAHGFCDDNEDNEDEASESGSQ